MALAGSGHGRGRFQAARLNRRDRKIDRGDHSGKAALAGMASRNRSAARGYRPIRPAIPQLFRAARNAPKHGAPCPCAEIRQLTDVSKCNLQHYLSCKQPSTPHLLGSSPEQLRSVTRALPDQLKPAPEGAR
jgi:hypothetical protein